MREIDDDLAALLADYARLAARAQPRRGFKYDSIHEALLEEGTAFPSGRYTPEEEELLLDVFGGTSGSWRIKQCFYNAQSIALQDRRLGYAEGYVLRLGLPLPLEHGWNFIPESGKPVDVTLRERGEKDACEPHELLERAARNLENAYLGVPIPPDEVNKFWLRMKRSEALIFFPDTAVGIMRRGFPRTWMR